MSRVNPRFLPGAFFLFGLLTWAPPTLAQSPVASELKPEHQSFVPLVGQWQVRTAHGAAGSAEARTRLGGRFLEVEISVDSGPVRHSIYTFGFDDRHGVFTVIGMDQSGNYWVTGKGTSRGSRIPMYGRDDDPMMASMGLEKEFLIELALISEDSITISTRLIDNRTEERREIPFLEFILSRQR